MCCFFYHSFYIDTRVIFSMLSKTSCDFSLSMVCLFVTVFVELQRQQNKSEDYNGSYKSLNYLQKLHTSRCITLLIFPFRFFILSLSFLLLLSLPLIFPTLPTYRAFCDFELLFFMNYFSESLNIMTQQQQGEKMYVATLKMFFPKKKRKTLLHNIFETFCLFFLPRLLLTMSFSLWTTKS
jgi:hypothetical protein